MKETHLKGRLQAIALTACAAAMIWACRETAAEAKTAAGLCLTVMIPSLYAFTVLSKLMISCSLLTAPNWNTKKLWQKAL